MSVSHSPTRASFSMNGRSRCTCPTVTMVSPASRRALSMGNSSNVTSGLQEKL